MSFCDFCETFATFASGRPHPEPVALDGLYEFMIDTNGDAVADIAFQVRFAAAPGGGQLATVRRREGAPAATRGERGEVVVTGAPVSMGGEAKVTEAGDYRLFAGWRSDP